MNKETAPFIPKRAALHSLKNYEKQTLLYYRNILKTTS